MTKMDHFTKGGNIALAPMLDFLNHTTEAKVINKICRFYKFLMINLMRRLKAVIMCEIKASKSKH